jgi:hypothetical protein
MYGYIKENIKDSTEAIDSWNTVRSIIGVCCNINDILIELEDLVKDDNLISNSDNKIIVLNSKTYNEWKSKGYFS